MLISANTSIVHGITSNTLLVNYFKLHSVHNTHA